jgi:predicted membrane metal-binding protein
MKYFFTKNFHLINLSPLLLLTLCFIIGINYHCMLIPFLVIFLVALCSFLIAHMKGISFPTQLLICSFFTLAGAWLHHKEWNDYHQFYSFIHNQKTSIMGTVIDVQKTFVNHKKLTAVTLAIHTIATQNTPYKSNKLCVFHIKCNKNIEVGDTVTFHDVICKKPSNENFQRYQIKEQVYATIFDETINYCIDHHPVWSLRRTLWQTKKRLLDALQHKLSPPSFRFFSSLFLGNRACIKQELEDTNEQFKTWGISHFLARSGLHLVLFIFMWQALLSLIPLPLIIKQIIMVLLSCIYFLLTWTSAPFTRSFALFLFNKLCIFSKISFHLLHYLTLVCFLFLLYCPLYLFFLDFQLSFALTFALAWLNSTSLCDSFHPVTPIQR